jgi:2-oxoisovalerate dehydrogenase E2 component (dihydrolipoyl transacylase)
MKTFKLPDLGEGLHEVEIVNWHVGEGDSVVADQPLVSVETDKAVVEVPSPYTGRVAKTYGKPGDIVHIGEPLADFDDGAPRADSGTVVGVIPVEQSAPPPERETTSGAAVKAMPAVRALAKKLGVDLLAVDASGANGAITAEDVKRHAAEFADIEPAMPVRGVRRAMAQKMAQSHAEIAPASIHDEADVEAWIAKGDVTVRLIRAILAACRVSPTMNAWFSAKDMNLRIRKAIDLGVAVNTEDGLFVAVMRNVHARDDHDLREGLEELKRCVAERSIPIEDMRGATITLSNFGVFGAGRFANLVIVPPQVTIVGAGTIRARAVVRDGAVVARRTLPISVTFDHRAATGEEAARFMKALIEDLSRAESAAAAEP